MVNGARKNRENVLRRGKSAEHYADTKFRHSVMIDVNEKPNPIVRGKSEDLALLDPKYPPIAITSVCGNIPYRTTNPRRKLRRHTNDKSADLYDPSVILSRGDLPFRKVCSYEPSRGPITIERILVASADRCSSLSALKSSQESLLEERAAGRKPLRNCPLSPTHYQQPPTPDHPPPSAVLAEKRIHDRIRPLSQVSTDCAVTYFVGVIVENRSRRRLMVLFAKSCRLYCLICLICGTCDFYRQVNLVVPESNIEE